MMKRNNRNRVLYAGWGRAGVCVKYIGGGKVEYVQLGQ